MCAWWLVSLGPLKWAHFINLISFKQYDRHIVNQVTITSKLVASKYYRELRQRDGLEKRVELLSHSPLSGTRIGLMASTAKLLKLTMGDCYVLVLWPRMMHVIVRVEAERRDLRANEDELHHCWGFPRSMVMHWHSLLPLNIQWISNLRHELLSLVLGWAFVLIG